MSTSRILQSPELTKQNPVGKLKLKLENFVGEFRNNPPLKTILALQDCSKTSNRNY